MALDAVCLQAAVREIAPQVEGLKIEKIQQPARDQVVLLLRGSRRLLLCASASRSMQILFYFISPAAGVSSRG